MQCQVGWNFLSNPRLMYVASSFSLEHSRRPSLESLVTSCHEHSDQELRDQRTVCISSEPSPLLLGQMQHTSSMSESSTLAIFELSYPDRYF